MKKGLAVISKILLMVVILVVGFSSYTAYMYFADPFFDFYGVGKYLGLEGSAVEQEEVDDVDYASLLPDVHKYVDGANADMIVAYRRNEELVKFVGSATDNQTDEFYEANSGIVEAFGVVIGPSEENKNTGALILAVEFDNDESLTLYQEMADLMFSFSSDMDGETEVNENTLIVRLYGEMFEGSVIDNPLIKKMSIDYVDSDVIALVDPAGIPEISSAVGDALGLSLMTSNLEGGLKDTSEMSAFEKFVHASSRMASFSEFEALYLKVGEGTIDVRFIMDVIDNADVDGGRITEKEYGDIQATFGEAVEELNEKGAEANPAIEDLSMVFEGNRLTVDISIPQPTIFDAPMRAREAARIAHLNQIVTALEMYSLDNGEYFEKSACVSDIQSLGPYFPRGELPVDPEGSVTFVNAGDGGDITCPDGYFYQYFGNGEYVLWAKMEVDEGGDGNQNGFYVDKSDLLKVEGGAYYIYNNTNSDVPGEMYPYVGDLSLELMEDLEEETPAKIGVPRGVPRT